MEIEYLYPPRCRVLQINYCFWLNWRCSQNYYPSLSDWWELGKYKIKNLTIKYCSKKATERRAEWALLSRLVDHLKSQVDLGRLFCLGPYQSTLTELSRFDLQAARGAQVRSRVRWVEEGNGLRPIFFASSRNVQQIVVFLC